jgi:hypothetical protein
MESISHAKTAMGLIMNNLQKIKAKGEYSVGKICRQGGRVYTKAGMVEYQPLTEDGRKSRGIEQANIACK